MRIIHLLPFSFHANLRTFVALMRSIADAAVLHDCTTTVVVKPGAREREWVSDLTGSSIPVRFLPSDPKVQAAKALTALVNESSLPTVLHSHFTSYDIAAALAGLRRPQTAVFWHVHSFLQPQLKKKLRNFVKFGLFGQFPERILCVAPHLVDGVISRGAPRRKVLLFPNAIESDRFQLVSPDMRADARRSLGIPLSANVLLHFGWNTYIKGTDIFLGAVRALSQEGRNVIGVSVNADAEALSLRRNLALEDSVRFVPTRNDVETLYAAADVFVASGRSEGAPAAILEALCCGLPVIATDIAGHEFNIDGSPMVRKASVDAESVAAAIGHVLDEREQLVGAAVSAREQILAERDLGPWSARLFALYNEVFDSARAG